MAQRRLRAGLRAGLSKVHSADRNSSGALGDDAAPPLDVAGGGAGRRPCGALLRAGRCKTCRPCALANIWPAAPSHPTSPRVPRLHPSPCASITVRHSPTGLATHVVREPKQGNKLPSCPPSSSLAHGGGKRGRILQHSAETECGWARHSSRQSARQADSDPETVS